MCASLLDGLLGFWYCKTSAEVVKLVDTPGSGSGEGNFVGVRLPPSALLSHAFQKTKETGSPNITVGVRAR